MRPRVRPDQPSVSPRLFIPLLFFLIFFSRVPSSPAFAALVKLTPPAGRAGDAFGASVAISPGTALVGRPGDDGDGTDAGAAEVFIRVGANWIPQARLVPQNGGPYGFFGSGVALSGDRALVGAPHGDGNSWGTGAAYVFRRVGTSWAQEAWLKASDGQRNDAFGRSVALDGGYAAAGAHRDGGQGAESGAVYLFENTSSGWPQTAKLALENGAAGDHFGWSLDLDGDRLVAGAPHRGGRGAAYVFRKGPGGWALEAALSAPAGAGSDFFGFSVAIGDGTVLVGAPGNDDGAAQSGAVFAFSEAGGAWTFAATLSPEAGAGGDHFGRSVSLDGGWAAIGADGADANGLSSGRVYLFREEATGWRRVTQTDAGEGETGDRLGWPAAVAGESASCTVLLGARGDDDAGEDGGAAYVLSYPSAGGSAPDIQIGPRAVSLTNGCGPRQSFGGEDDLPPAPASGGETGEYATGLVIPQSVRDYWAAHPSSPRAPVREVLPTQVDWSPYDSPVRSQGSCGSCSAFAAAALIENLMNQAGLPVPADVSEQTFLACGPLSCAGGWYWDALDYAAEYGVPPEACYEYGAVTGSCFLRCPNPAYLVRLGQFTASPGLWAEDQSYNDLRVALQEGPLVVSMRVPDDGSFAGTRYRGGVYDYDGGFIPWDQNAHAVLLVGYDDATQSFKVKNSWGADWGDNGYFRIAYDDVQDDVKFGSFAVSASLAYLSGPMGTATVTNTGGQPLAVSEIRSDVTWLDISPAGGFSVAPGEQRVLSFQVNDWERVNIPEETATITLFSNDPDEGRAMLSVTAERQNCRPEDLPGDLNGLDGVNLADAVLGLQVLSGIQVTDIRQNYPESGADVDGNGRVGFPEVLYVLRLSADLP
jgi:hypothetical protein